MQLTDIKPRSYALDFKNGSENIKAVITDNGCWELTLTEHKGHLLVISLVKICKTIFELELLKDIPSIKIPLPDNTALMVYREDDIATRLMGQISINL